MNAVILQQWVIPIFGVVVSLVGVGVSWAAYREAAGARRAADAARDAAIRAQRELTVHRELLPQVEALDVPLKALVEGLTTATQDQGRLNEVIDRLSKVSHAATVLKKKEVGELLSQARERLSASALDREGALSARNLVNEATAKLRYDSDSVRALAGGGA